MGHPPFHFPPNADGQAGHAGIPTWGWYGPPRSDRAPGKTDPQHSILLLSSKFSSRRRLREKPTRRPLPARCISENGGPEKEASCFFLALSVRFWTECTRPSAIDSGPSDRLRPHRPVIAQKREEKKRGPVQKVPSARTQHARRSHLVMHRLVHEDPGPPTETKRYGPWASIPLRWKGKEKARNKTTGRHRPLCDPSDITCISTPPRTEPHLASCCLGTAVASDGSRRIAVLGPSWHVRLVSRPACVRGGRWQLSTSCCPPAWSSPRRAFQWATIHHPTRPTGPKRPAVTQKLPGAK